MLTNQYGLDLAAGEFLFREGEEGDRMYIIQDGRIILTRNIDGKAHLIAQFEKGDFFGEMALINRIKRTATAKAEINTRLLSFDRTEFAQMIEKNPKIALNMIDKLCRRLQNANLQIQQFVQSSSRQSLLTGILVFSERESGLGKETDLEAELAQSFDCPLDQVQKMISELVLKGVLERENDQIEVKNHNMLTKMMENS